MKHFRSFTMLMALLGTLAGPSVARCADEATRQAMHRVFDAVAYLLPLSMRLSEGGGGEIDDLARAKMDALTASAKELSAHGATRDREFRLLTRSLERVVADTRYAFEEGESTWAFYSLKDLTQHCAACHARLPDDRNYTLGQRLMARMNVDALDGQELAELLVATRQFDQALDVLERKLLDADIEPIELDLAGTFVDYLKVSVAAEQRFDRPRALLERFLERGDLPVYLRRRVGVWQRSMTELEARRTEEPTLDNARRLFAESTNVTAVPSGGDRAIYDVFTESLLRRYIESNHDVPPAALSEAYYLLALIALRTTEVKPAVPDMEILLEAAIRTHPQGETAKQAYALLEEFGAVHDGPIATVDDQPPFLNLAELRALLETKD